MEPGPPAEEEPPEEPNTESFLAALLVEDAQVVVDSVTGKASVAEQKARTVEAEDGEAGPKDRP
jgi:hypothetical protein